MIPASSPTTTTIGAAVRNGIPATGRHVTDAPTRMFHWLFALTFAGAYLTAESEHSRQLHVALGYTFAGLLGFRLAYGVLGPRQAGLGLLLRRLAGAPAWLRSLRSPRTAPSPLWRQGQNLATACAVVAMLALAVPLALSGHGTYEAWGDSLGGDWLEETHEALGKAFLTVAVVHIGLVASLSLLRRRNLALPMLTGRAEGSGPGPVQHDRAWLAALLLVAATAFGVWLWLDSSRPLPPGRGNEAEFTVRERPAAGGRRHDDDD
jgi:cytochrome b